jgi:predicted  nucleic acid-binding Zn-ribbon protein
MTEKGNKSDLGSVISDLENLKIFFQRFNQVLKSLPPEKQDERLYQSALQVSGINFPDLLNTLNELNDELITKEAESYGNNDFTQQLEELKQELKAKNDKINEFKLSLADSVMEFKDLKRKYAADQERFQKLSKEISQMQMHIKDLRLKLETAENNYATAESERQKNSEELYEQKSQNYNYKSKIAEFEDKLALSQKNLKENREKFQRQEEELIKQSKHKADLETTLARLRHENSAIEERFSEMEETIEVLQKEKNTLQTKLERFLTGIPKSFVYSFKGRHNPEEANLHPLSFVASLPFCFPERLPALQHFRRQIKQTFAKDIKRKPQHPPKVLQQSFSLKLRAAHPRTLAYKPIFAANIPENFAQIIPQIYIEKTDFSLNFGHGLFEPAFVPEKSAMLEIECKKDNLLRTSVAGAKKRLELPETPDFLIATHSLDLLLSYLSRNIVEANYLELAQQEAPANESFVNLLDRKPRLKINIFNEKLAFRYGYQLKSHRIKLQRLELKYNFRTGSGLKSVLETFGNTISSMVSKYGIFAKTDSEKNDKLKT